MSKKIELTQGEFAVIDDSDYSEIIKFKWCLKRNVDGKLYAINSVGILMHRLLLGAERGQIVDHADGDGLNNTRKNIRICTQSQNLQNKRVSSASKTGLKGVRINKGVRGYRAYIIKGGKQFSIGTFKTAKEAALAYDAVARKLYGDFARTNFKEGEDEFIASVTPTLNEVLTKIYGKINRAKVHLSFDDKKATFEILQEISDYMASIDLPESSINPAAIDLLTELDGTDHDH